MFDRSDLHFELGLAAEWRQHLAPSQNFFPARTFDRTGLEALVQEAMASWPQNSLPWNLSTHGPAVGLPRWKLLQGSFPDMVGEYARFAGWLKAVSKDGLAVRVITAAVCSRGVNSPANLLDLWRLSRRYTPGALSRRLRAIRARAELVLTPYGVKPSRAALAVTLARGPKATGKAAIYAASLTLDRSPRHRQPASYKDARDRLVRLSRRDCHTADGITVHGALRSRAGYQYIAGFTMDPSVPWRRAPMCVIERPDGRSYHACGEIAGLWFTQHIAGEYKCRRGVAALLLRAQKAWAAQDRAAAIQNVTTDSSVVTILATRQDSREAGNCLPGTEAFLADHGWSHRHYVPTTWLLATGDSRAISAAAIAERRFQETVAAA